MTPSSKVLHGWGEDYSVGDKINIFYNPANPESIVVPFSFRSSYLALTIGVMGLIITVLLIVFMVKNSHKFYLGTKDTKNNQQ